MSDKRDGYNVTMNLTIANVTKSDMGVYFCNASNSLGKAESAIRIYGKINVISSFDLALFPGKSMFRWMFAKANMSGVALLSGESVALLHYLEL